MRTPCPREPPRAALEGFSMHGPARRRPRKTPRDSRCFVGPCYVAHRMLPRPEPALMPSGTTSLRATCTRKLPTPVKLADLLRPLERGPVLLTRRRVDRHQNTVIHACVHPHKVVVMESPNLFFACHTKGPAVVSHGLAPASATPPGFAGSIVIVVTSRPRATGTSRVRTNPSKPRPART